MGRFLPLFILWVLLGGGSANAFAPLHDAGRARQVARPGPGALRVFQQQAPKAPRAELRRSSGVRFKSVHKKWSMLWDSQTLSPGVLFGEGLTLFDPQTPPTNKFVDGSRSFLASHAELFGVDARDLETVSSRGGGKAWYVRLEQTFRGLPVIGSGVDFRFKNGKLVLIRANLHPDITVATTPTLTASQVEKLATDSLSTDGWTDFRSLKDSRLGVWVQRSARGVAYRLVWTTRHETGQPRGRWVSHVDARTGVVWKQTNEFLYASDTNLTVQGWVEPRKVGDVQELQNFPYLEVEVPGGGGKRDDRF